jgi:protein-S-isoprenylcysteine O-methyltransferase
MAGIGLLATFFAVEGRLRQGESARSLHAGESDRGTTLGIAAAFVTATVVGPALARSRRGRCPVAVGWVGVGLMSAGLSLRLWSARTLGGHYTRTLRVGAGHQIVEAGPYALVRHPGYAGSLLMWFGFGFALTSLPATVAITVPMLAAYTRRIEAEEDMLAGAFGDEYRSYQERTARLLPGVY